MSSKKCEECWMPVKACECAALDAFNIREACGEHARFRDGMELDEDEGEEAGDYYANPDDERDWL